jgi:hypothetical protein
MLLYKKLVVLCFNLFAPKLVVLCFNLFAPPPFWVIQVEVFLGCGAVQCSP